MKPGVLAAIVVVVLLAVGGFLYVQSSSDDEPAATSEPSSQLPQSTPATETSTPTETANDSTEQLLKAEEVAAHAAEDDCWTIIDGVVYDITPYVPRHPGGDEILRTCGTDGSSLFNQRTTDGGEKVGSGTPHSANAASQLADFKIGVLDTTAE